jgi:transcriptional regulator with XRE-family HTH domain
MTELSPKAIGHQIFVLREAAKLKQAELARKVTWSPAVLSRVESGEREMSEDELAQLLNAIGSDDALRLADRLSRRWSILATPPLDHPEQDALWEAERAAVELQSLVESEAVTASFQRRIDEYLGELKRCAARVLKRDHTVAFLGGIGIGKSTAICRLTELEILQDGKLAQPVLEAGGGGITLCEVHLYSGPQYGITVEPCPEDVVRQHVNDFVDHLRGPSQGEAEQNAEAGDMATQGISKEIERAIRNMSGLKKPRKEKIDGAYVKSNDDAKALAEQYPNNRQLVVEILARMQLHKRDARHVWYDPASGKLPLQWLKETFEKINNGRHEDFGLPRRMEVIVPTAILGDSDLSLRLVDTKGIDQTRARADLEVHLNDPHTLAVLCTRFNEAPAADARMLLERAKEAGVRNLTLKAALVAFPHPDEALSMKDDGGEKAESVEEGYELKADQARTALEPLGLQELAIGFFNAREDDPKLIKSFIWSQLNRVRSHFLVELQEATQNIRHVIENQEEEQSQAVIRDVASQLQHWISTHRECPKLRKQIQETLIRDLKSAHASTIRATIRRQGEWPNLDFRNELGHGAKIVATSSLGRLVKDFQAVAQNLSTNPDHLAATKLVSQTEKVLLVAFDGLLEKMQLLGETIFEDELKSDVEFWARCEREWGIGYRDKISARSEKWFEADEREDISTMVQQLLAAQWTEILDRVEALLDV